MLIFLLLFVFFPYKLRSKQHQAGAFGLGLVHLLSYGCQHLGSTMGVGLVGFRESLLRLSSRPLSAAISNLFSLGTGRPVHARCLGVPHVMHTALGTFFLMVYLHLLQLIFGFSLVDRLLVGWVGLLLTGTVCFGISSSSSSSPFSSSVGGLKQQFQMREPCLPLSRFGLVKPEHPRCISWLQVPQFSLFWSSLNPFLHLTQFCAGSSVVLLQQLHR